MRSRGYAPSPPSTRIPVGEEEGAEGIEEGEVAGVGLVEGAEGIEEGEGDGEGLVEGAGENIEVALDKEEGSDGSNE